MDRVTTKTVAVQRQRENKKSNAIIGWILLAAVLLLILICIVFKTQTASFLNGTQSASTMALSSDVLAPAGAPLRSYAPECGLDESRPVCKTALPAPFDCLKQGGMLNGVAVGDAAIFPGSYWNATVYNTGAFGPSCGELPRSCAPTCAL